MCPCLGNMHTCHARMHAYVYACMHACMHACMYICMHVCHACPSLREIAAGGWPLDVYMRMYTCTRAWMALDAHVRMRVCMLRVVLGGLLTSISSLG